MPFNTDHAEQSPHVQEGTNPSAEDGGCSNFAICNPHTVFHRYLIVVFICTIGVGDYFAVDNPAALQGHMLKDMDLSETQYMGFYSWYRWTFIAASLLGGYLIDRILGNRLTIVLCSSMMAISHSVFAIGAYVNNYWLMCIGRALFGMVESPLAIANDNLIVKWFKSKELCMVLSLKTSVARMGSVLNMNVMEPIYQYVGRYFSGHKCLGISLLAGVAVCLISSICACVATSFDKRADRLLLSKVMKTKTESIRLSDVGKFPLAYWLVAITTTIFYLAVFPFVGLGLVYFVMKYNYSPAVADNINGLVYLVAAISMPIFGLCIDKVGKNLLWMFFGIVLCFASHILLAFTFVNPYIPMAMLGTGYSVFTATVWPLIPHVVNQQHLGTAYGIMAAILGVGQAIATYLSGYLVDTRGYLVLEVFFIASAFVALILGAFLFIVDSTKGGFLNLTAAVRKQYMTLNISDPELTIDESQITKSDPTVKCVNKTEYINTLDDKENET